MTTLANISGIRARIYTLPGRPPFMTSADLATVYGTTVKALNRAVQRNPKRFPEDFAFRLTADEEAERWSQSGTTSPGKRTDVAPLVYTHGGANALSGVLRTPVADEMSVAVHRAFTEMERAALADANRMLAKFRGHAILHKRIYGWVRHALAEGWTIDQLAAATSAHLSRPKLESAARELLATGAIDRLPQGMQADLFGA